MRAGAARAPRLPTRIIRVAAIDQLRRKISMQLTWVSVPTDIVSPSFSQESKPGVCILISMTAPAIAMQPIEAGSTYKSRLSGLVCMSLSRIGTVRAM